MKALLIFSLLAIFQCYTVQPVVAQDHEHQAMEVEKVHGNHSIYHLNAQWTNHREDVLRLDDFRGDLVIIVMFYGKCTEVCPILIQDTWRLFSQLSEAAQEHVNVVAVTFDPENDTPDVMYEYAEFQQLNRKEWHFLTGDKASVRELAMLLGVQYRERSDGMFEHSNLIAVLDQEGRVIRQIEGLGQPVEEAVKVIETLTGVESDT